ncbi:uncharacterized protein N7446_012204 [Penicillium canescens]|uniref:uncharacterized protein n=1 Tax=Penicillium canescens TaxID=5083 RepID=UPI0026E07B01|nr:uncharacterized protein N7446_012204 [Penicillium canescens]KAJ6045340.1 hypothetical protein N7446_012204 [Penicillium canescens]
MHEGRNILRCIVEYDYLILDHWGLDGWTKYYGLVCSNNGSLVRPHFPELIQVLTYFRYLISGVEAWLPSRSSGFVIIGDSITDGQRSTLQMQTIGMNASKLGCVSRITERDSWPDLLLKKMQKHDSTSNIATLNETAGGNRILRDGLGPSVLSRIDRDVLAQSGVRYATIFEGITDTGVASTDAVSQDEIDKQLVAAYKQIVTRIHALCIPVFGATITPGIFDAVLDFDRVLRDPQAPPQLLGKYDSGNHLHPNVAGYQALADSFPLDIFSGSD